MLINKKISKSLLASLCSVMVISSCSTTNNITNSNTSKNNNSASTSNPLAQSEEIAPTGIQLFYQNESGGNNPVTPEMIQSIKMGNEVIGRKDIKIVNSSEESFTTKADDAVVKLLLLDGYYGNGNYDRTQCRKDIGRRICRRSNTDRALLLSLIINNVLINTPTATPTVKPTPTPTPTPLKAKSISPDETLHIKNTSDRLVSIPFIWNSLDNMRILIKYDGTVIGAQVDETGNFIGTTFSVNGQNININYPNGKTVTVTVTDIENGIDDKKLSELAKDNQNAKTDSENIKNEIPIANPIVSFAGKWVYKPLVGLPIYFTIKDVGNNKVYVITDFMGQTYSGQSDYNSNSATEGLIVNTTFKGMNAKIKLTLKGDSKYDRKLDVNLTDAGGISEISMYQGVTVTLDRNLE